MLDNVPIAAGHAAKRVASEPRIFVFLLVGSLCLTRPSFLGQDFNYLGGLGIVLATLAFLLTRSHSRVVLGRASPQLNIAIALSVFWCYVFGSAIFFGNSTIPLLLKATSAGLSVPICFLLLSSNGNLVGRSFAIIARINSLLGYSFAVTFCLLPLVGYNGLRVGTYTITGYESAAEGGAGDILFPFTVVYGQMVEYGIYRFCGLFREAGIAQAFFIWAIVYLLYSRARVFWILGAVLGALLCGATAVVFSVAAVVVVHFGWRSLHRPKDLLLLVSLLVVLTLLFLYVPGLGLLDKAVTHSASVTDRQHAMEMALPGSNTWQWLIGRGLFYGASDKVENTGINAIASVYQFGAIGFVLYVATFFAGMIGTRSRDESVRYLTLVSPLLVTSLFFQPVIDAPFVMAALFCFPPDGRKTGG